MFLRFIILLAVALHVRASLKEFIKFQQIEYENLPSKLLNLQHLFKFLMAKMLRKKASGNFPFIPYNNVAQGFAPYITANSSKVFIAVPRRSLGVPSTLNYVELKDGQDLYVNPKLRSYPNYKTNELDVSVCSPRCDAEEKFKSPQGIELPTNNSPDAEFDLSCSHP